MYQYKLYNSKDIEKLKQELEFYKQKLDTVDTSDLLVKHFKTQQELYNLKSKFSKFKGAMKVMKEEYNERLTDYKSQEQTVTEQIQLINDSLNQLKQDVNMIKDEIEEMHITELLKKMNILINKTEENLTSVRGEIVSQKEELLQLKENSIPRSSKKTSPRPSEYRQLLNMLQSSNNMEQVPSIPKSNMTTKRISNKPFSDNQTTRKTRPFPSSKSTIPGGNETRTFRSSQYELNKNIITRTSTSKNKKKIDTDNYDNIDTPFIKNNDTSHTSKNKLKKEDPTNFIRTKNNSKTNQVKLNEQEVSYSTNAALDYSNKPGNNHSQSGLDHSNKQGDSHSDSGLDHSNKQRDRHSDSGLDHSNIQRDSHSESGLDYSNIQRDSHSESGLDHSNKQRESHSDSGLDYSNKQGDRSANLNITQPIKQNNSNPDAKITRSMDHGFSKQEINHLSTDTFTSNSKQDKIEEKLDSTDTQYDNRNKEHYQEKTPNIKKDLVSFLSFFRKG